MSNKLNIRAQADRARVFNILLESLSDGIWLWNIACGKFDLISHSAQSIIGSDLDEYNQDPEKWAYNIHPSDREGALQAVTQTLFETHHINIEYRLANELGKFRWVKDTRKLIVGATSEPQHIFGTLVDITEQKQKNHILEEAQLSYMVMFMHHPNSMWVASCPEGKILEANDAAVKHFGYTRKEFCHLKFCNLAENEESVKDKTQSGFTSNAATLIKKNGKHTKVIITSADYTHLGKNAKLIMAIDITREIEVENELTELNKRLEERVRKRTQDLELANSSLQDFAHSISHDLRAPVRHIRNFAQMVMDKSKDTLDEDSRNYQGYVIEATNKLSEQIEGLLQFSRVGSKLINYMEVDLQKMVLYTMDQAKYQFPNQVSQFHINQPLPVLYADHVLLEQVFANLFSNAIKYSSKQPESIVWLNYTDLGGYHQFEVKDNGAGFDMKYSDKLFNMFSRLHSQSEFEGNGIGLVNVKKIIERHEGKVWVNSALGEGASFFFTLPKTLENEELK